MHRLLGFVFGLAFSVGLVAAQNVTNTTEGISGDIDSKRRSPVLSVTVSRDSSAVKLLTDAHVPNPDYQKYPIKFDFFVNRKLFATQIRSTELPGAVGVDIGSDVALTPFNYSVVATVLHPNREFTTVLNGAVFGSNLIATLSCNLSITDPATDETTEYSVEETQTKQPSADKLSLEFEATNLLDEGDSATLSGDLILNSTTLSGTLSLDLNGAPASKTFSGEAVLENDALISFALDSDDQTASLSCE